MSTFIEVTSNGNGNYDAKEISCDGLADRNKNRIIFKTGIIVVVDFLNKNPIKNVENVKVFLDEIEPNEKESLRKIFCFLNRFLRFNFKNLKGPDKNKQYKDFDELINIEYSGYYNLDNTILSMEVTNRFSLTFDETTTHQQDNMIFFAFVFLIFLTAPKSYVRGTNTDNFVKILNNSQVENIPKIIQFISKDKPKTKPVEENQIRMTEFILDNMQLFRVIAKQITSSDGLKNLYFMINKISNISTLPYKNTLGFNRGGSSNQSKTKQKRHNHYKNGSTRRNKSQNIDY